jgi:hypothetical protein
MDHRRGLPDEYTEQTRGGESRVNRQEAAGKMDLHESTPGAPYRATGEKQALNEVRELNPATLAGYQVL